MKAPTRSFRYVYANMIRADKHDVAHAALESILIGVRHMAIDKVPHGDLIDELDVAEELGGRVARS